MLICWALSKLQISLKNFKLAEITISAHFSLEQFWPFWKKKSIFGNYRHRRWIQGLSDMILKMIICLILRNTKCYNKPCEYHKPYNETNFQISAELVENFALLGLQVYFTIFVLFIVTAAMMKEWQDHGIHLWKQIP